ncbi:sortase [Candidatus Roizmanbacteria bacterium]|nr:sortase [Candidatus Roizmanbacteria bacterium]
MAFSFFGLLFIYFPLIKVYFFPPQPLLPPHTKFSIAIPKINALAPVVENVDPWSRDTYQLALEKGVAHAKGTALPGEHKTIYLFAHSSDDPWKITRYNTVFLKLGLLDLEDEIVLTKEGIAYTYRVREKKTVPPSSVEYLMNLATDQLILQTCTPPGTDWQRLLVFADPV